MTARAPIEAEGWGIVNPDGTFLTAAIHFPTAAACWALTFAWQDVEEISALKSQGYRAVRVRITEIVGRAP